MDNMWEKKSVEVLQIADAIRDLGVLPVSDEDEAERIGRAMQLLAGRLAANGAALMRISDHPIMTRPRRTFGQRGG